MTNKEELMCDAPPKKHRNKAKKRKLKRKSGDARKYQIWVYWKPEFARERKTQTYRTNRGDQTKELNKLVLRILDDRIWGRFVIAELREIGAEKGHFFWTDTEGEMNKVQFYNQFTSSNEYIAKWFQKRKADRQSAVKTCLYKAFITSKGKKPEILDSVDVMPGGLYGDDVAIANFYKTFTTKPFSGTFDRVTIYRQDAANAKVGAFLPNGRLVFYKTFPDFEKEMRGSTNFKNWQLGIRN